MLYFVFIYFYKTDYRGHMFHSLENKLLIADPFLQDAIFKRSVIIICNHSHDGSIGFLLNKKYQHPLCYLLSDFDGMKIPVYLGGPVEKNTIHFLHQYPSLIPNSQIISNEIAWGGDFDVLKELIFLKKISLQKVKFFLGYSGWSAGQLNQELIEKSWLLGQTSERLVFNTGCELIWKASIQTMDEWYHEIIHYPIDPLLN